MKRLVAITTLFFTVFFLFFLAAAGSPGAESAISCHCFTQRGYNPGDRFAADDYILATSFNSLLARSFAVPKREIVMLKMKQGVGRNDLLVGLKIAGAAGVDLRSLLELRRQGQSWAEIVAGLAMDEKTRQDPVLEAIESSVSVAEAGDLVADQLIAGFYAVPLELIRMFRKSGLNQREINLLLILAHAGNRQPGEIAAMYTREGKSWSEIAASLGIEPVEAGRLILRYPARQPLD
ncbi:MAG: hypothetical protein L3J03_09775 [Desulfobacterales bacterium]|nr:hypothetical protein [Desulfobacterales bacterium]